MLTMTANSTRIVGVWIAVYTNGSVCRRHHILDHITITDGNKTTSANTCDSLMQKLSVGASQNIEKCMIQFTRAI